MDDSQPRKYFLSRKTVLKTLNNNGTYNPEGVPVIVDPVVQSKDYLIYKDFLTYTNYCASYFKPHVFNNGAYLSHEKSWRERSYMFQLLEERDGLLKVLKKYKISWLTIKEDDFKIKLLSNDLKYVIVVTRLVRQATLIKPLKTKLFLHIAKCSPLMEIDEGIQSYNVEYTQGDCILTENKRHFKKKDFRLATVVCGMISPQQTYLCLVIEASSGIHLNLYRIDLENNVVKFHSSVDVSMEFPFTLYLDIKMNDNESMIMLRTRLLAKSTYHAILYSIEDGLLHPISCNGGSVIRFCCHLDHVFYGYLVFLLLETSHKKEFVLEILKYTTMGLERWIKINLSEDFGLKNYVLDFFVQGSADTRVFLNNGPRMYVINPFNGRLLYVVEQIDNVDYFMNAYINWNGQEVFGLRKNRDHSFEFLVYYLPKDNELSLTHSAAIVVMGNYSKNYLKTLNLPKTIKYILGITSA